ncbi:hypothetical protein CDAR_16731 [Caerostris darwini]|uniref:Uncharacterized protein n=1 Tax=Caerostris darwini TaxID=1538125 RepID=A0AAV4M6S0_9ARAC|nr:hypothetical protein CDAR_16731 [Caerostris darwini]
MRTLWRRSLSNIGNLHKILWKREEGREILYKRNSGQAHQPRDGRSPTRFLASVRLPDHHTTFRVLLSKHLFKLLSWEQWKGPILQPSSSISDEVTPRVVTLQTLIFEWTTPSLAN